MKNKTSKRAEKHIFQLYNKPVKDGLLNSENSQQQTVTDINKRLAGEVRFSLIVTILILLMQIFVYRFFY
jgi:hypothetical protein